MVQYILCSSFTCSEPELTLYVLLKTESKNIRRWRTPNAGNSSRNKDTIRMRTGHNPSISDPHSRTGDNSSSALARNAKHTIVKEQHSVRGFYAASKEPIAFFMYVVSNLFVSTILVDVVWCGICKWRNSCLAPYGWLYIAYWDSNRRSRFAECSSIACTYL